MAKPKTGFSRSGADTQKVKMIARLKVAREYIGASQGKVAAYLGLPRSAVSEIEGGKRKISAIELKKLSELYQRPVAWFIDDVVQGVPADVEYLARTATELSDNDRSELQKFADFLKSKAETANAE